MLKLNRWQRLLYCAAFLSVLTVPGEVLRAQATSPPAGPSGVGAVDDALAALGIWLERANREYRSLITNELSVPTEKGLAAERSAKSKTSAPVASAPAVNSKPAVAASREDASTMSPADQDTRQRQRLAEQARTLAANGTAGQKSPPAATDHQEPARTEATRPERAKPESPKSAPAKREAAREELRRVETTPAETRDDAGKRAAGAPEKTTPATGNIAKNTPRPWVGARPESNSAAGAGDSKRIPTPEELADAATKAGSEVLRSLEKPEPEKAQGSATPGKTKVTALLEEKPRKSARRSRCRDAGRDVDPPAYYTVKAGDNLWDISRRHYEKGHRYTRIVRANRGKIADPDLIFPCQRFFLPG